MADDELLPVVTARLLDEAELDATIQASVTRGTALLPLDGPVEEGTRYAVELQAPGRSPVTVAGRRDGDECGGLTPMRLEPMDERSAVSSRRADEALVGTTLGGKYLVEAVLGRGAMGTVYRATHATLRKAVAIKVLNRSLRDEATFAQRFHREALAASGLDHPNIVRVIDFGEDGEGLMYLAMDLLEGSDLASTLGGAMVPMPRIVFLMSQVCSALAAAHELGIVHRDIKPENIVLVSVRDEEGGLVQQVKVCDFGIARIAAPDRSPRLTQDNAILGTPAYMAPEQANGGAVDGRADVYACGVVLFEMATGRLPFDGDTPAELLVAHATRDPPRPSVIAAGIDPRLEAIILKAMEKSPERRFASARELRSALRTLVGESDGASLRLRASAPLAADPTTSAIAEEGGATALEDERPAAVIVDAAASIEIEGEVTSPESHAAVARSMPVGGPLLAAASLDAEDVRFPDFFLALTGAIARTTYYDRTHPEFGRAMVRLSGVVAPPLRGRREISFARQDTYEGPRITVMSGLGELFELRKLLSHSAFTTFGPHFVDVLQRRQVVTVTLREGVSVEELGDLVEILCGPEVSVADVRAKFQSRGLTRASLLFADDLLGRDRRLPWHVDVCISRLARDLRLLPMLRDVDPERLREFRTQLVCDVVRPLRNPDLVRTLLANGDLLQKSLHDTPGGRALDVTETIVNSLPHVMCLQLATVVLAELEKDAARGQGGGSAASPLVRVIGERFIRQRTVESDEVLRVLHERAVLSFPELPPDLQLWVLAEQQARELSADPERVLRSLDTVYDEARYAREVRTLSRAMRVLARRAEFGALLLAVARLERHARGAAPGEASREELAAQALQSVRDPEMLRLLATALLAGAPELRESARAIVGTAGQGAAEALCAAREKESDPPTPMRARFVEAVRELGPDALPAIGAALDRVDTTSEGADLVVEDLLRAVPEIADVTLGVRAERLLQHPSAAIRRAATTAVATLMGAAARHALVREVDDVDDGVRIAALNALQRLGVIDVHVISRIERILSDAVRASSELRSVAAASLAHVDAPSRERAIAILSRALEPPRTNSIASFVRAAIGSTHEDEPLLEALARTIVSLAGDVGKQRVEARAARSSAHLRARLLAVLSKAPSV